MTIEMLYGKNAKRVAAMIRIRHQAGESMAALARDYRVSPCSVRAVVRGPK